ncbi:hypothetical protein ISN44_As13g008160 [Arabidopsis suecica]|uniref:Uncharacterized protein n=1 Tax=Arabidopsis suecica TaxID=45249 RepID=A0A8T1XVW8_ARASU|nr:hypothetical protein ISN44_As13g008160 [Arabidopsis suecica]
MLPGPMESPEDHRDGYFCVYEVYFKGCGLTFPLPEALVRYLAALEIALPQLTPNILRTILGIISVAAEAGYVIGVPELNELLSVRSSSKKTGYFLAYPNAGRNLISHLPNKDENWHHPWFLIKKTLASIGNLSEGMSARALTAKRKVLSKPIIEACDENKEFLATAIDKKDYSRTLLVNDGTAEGARFAGAFRLTPRRERRGDHSPRGTRSPRRDSPRPSSRDDFSNEPLKNLIRKKRDRPSHSSSSPRREKSKPRTDRSPRSSPSSGTMAPPPPVAVSSSSQPSGEKTNQSAAPQKEGSGSRDASSKSKTFLVPQTKSLSAMEKEGSVFRCFKTRTGAILPDFDKWRPAIRERYLLHAYHSSRANGELNDMVEHYEGMLLRREQEINTWKDKFSTLEADLRSSSGSKQELEDQVDSLTSELGTIKRELSESESTAYTLTNQFGELDAKYKAITKLWDSELAKSASKARKEVKGHGMELIQGAIRFMQTEKARSIRLSAIPSSSFNPQQFEEFFTESPPLGESGLDWLVSSSETEGVNPSAVPTIPVVIPDDDCAVRNEPGASSEQVTAKEPNESSSTESARTELGLPRVPHFGFNQLGMEFNLRCSESMPDFSSIGMMDEDVPNVPSRRPSPPRGFFRSQIQAPCALIRDLPVRDQETAMAFIEALAIQHRKLTLERRKLRKKINRMQRRVTTISRDLHVLSSHPGEWIELGISEFARIPDCMMPILDLAGQGVQVFSSSRRLP